MRNLTFREHAALLRTLLIGAKFLKTAPFFSRDEMLAWQWDRVRRLVRHAYDKVPFYRDLYAAASFQPDDLKSWDDFHSLPTLKKDQVIANFPSRILEEGRRVEDLIVSRSSGSTGKALDVAYDSSSVVIFALAGLRLYRMGFPYRPWHRQLYIYTSPYPVESLFGLFPLQFVSTLTPIPQVIAQLRASKPDLLVCYPSHLKEITQNLSCLDLTEFRLRCISVNSEMSTQKERDILAQTFSCPVLDEYSSEELTRIASQCLHGTYHVFEDINYMESLSIGDSAMLVGTNLHNFAMPMIRYEQNDIGRLEVRECPCGWKFRHLVDLQGRRNDSFLLPSGRILSSGFLLDATYEVLLTFRSEVRDFCLIQKKLADVELEVVPGPGWNNDVQMQINGMLSQLLGSDVTVSTKAVEICTKTKSGKRNPIISEVTRSREM